MTFPSDDLVAHAKHINERYTPAQVAQLVRLISPVPSCGLMTPAEFELVMVMLASQHRRRAFSDRSVHAARLVLVMGASVAEAAADTGLARQVVHRLMARIRARMQGLPGSWVKVEAWLPPAHAKQVVDLAATLRAAHEAGKGVDVPDVDQVPMIG
ncbi:TrfB-related DNA-binding protein [Pseudomonas ovata]|uniref:TrfB-related DNA-binding protein n=1 Tax=Pseudomonas ovata TaxID=1839709 RepID=UPI000D692886|nr:TrfB-related DNA-binding protein [Pseudomonas ovata]